MTPDQYRIVFDLSQKGFRWWFPAFGLIFVVAGGVIVWLGKRNDWPRSLRFVGYFMDTWRFDITRDSDCAHGRKRTA
jgi:hypothetical protein